MSLQDSAAHQAAGSSSRKNNQYLIVLDTSVLISAFFFGGNAREVLLHIAKNQQMIVSEHIIDEFLDFAKNTIPKTPHRMLRLIRQTLEDFEEFYEQHNVEVRDINDVPILQLAIEHNALIVTGDKDLLEYKDDAKVAILSITECEEVLFK